MLCWSRGRNLVPSFSAADWCFTDSGDGAPSVAGKEKKGSLTCDRMEMIARTEEDNDLRVAAITQDSRSNRSREGEGGGETGSRPDFPAGQTQREWERDWKMVARQKKSQRRLSSLCPFDEASEEAEMSECECVEEEQEPTSCAASEFFSSCHDDCL